MNLDRVADMLRNAWSFDLEGHKIQAGLLAPPVVCASVARWDPQLGRTRGKLMLLDEAREVFVRLLDSDCTIVGANIAYDFLCLAVDFARRGIDIVPKIFAAYEAGRVFDVQIAEALHAVALGTLGYDPDTGEKLRDPITRKLGRYSLSICLWLVLRRKDAKVNDRFRTSYALLEGVPLDQWPPEAKVYPVDDACNTLDVALAQAGLIPRPSDHEWPDGGEVCMHCGVRLTAGALPDCPPRLRRSFNLHDIARQTYAAFSMHLGAAWGFAVDADAVDALADRVTKSRAAAIVRFLASGHLRQVTEKGVVRVAKVTSAIKRDVALAYGCTGACPTCAGTGKVKSAKSGNPTGCRMCDSTGLNLDSAPCPRTKGSKCRTCRGKREYLAGKPKSKRAALTAPAPGTVIKCAQCEGQPDVVPGCATGRDALYESGDDEVLVPFAAYSEESKLLEVYIPYLKRGIADVPDEEDEDIEEADE